MPEQLTLMAVHAHPDDEAIGTGGILARYSDQGIRTVLVTCTDGAMGDAPESGLKPGADGHDPDLVVKVRREELEEACRHLGVHHLEMLGYRDSGMMGWPQNDAEGSFWSTPVEEGGAKLSQLMEKYQPQVVVTYDDNGFYGHPDHIQAHRITMAAVDVTGIPKKLYFTAVPRSAIAEMMKRAREMGLPAPGSDNEGEGEQQPGGDTAEADPDNPPFGTPDELIAAVIDVGDVFERKRAALIAHRSQVTENSWFLQLPEEVMRMVFGREAFVRHLDTTGASLPEDDLFAGLR